MSASSTALFTSLRLEALAVMVRLTVVRQGLVALKALRGRVWCLMACAIVG